MTVLRHLRFERLGLLSTQVLGEYLQMGLRKLKLSPTHMREQLHCYRQFEVAHVTPETIG